jgi:integrase
MSEVMRRKSNGYGHTYKVGNSWRTVIRHQGRIISANSTNKNESRKRAREKYLLAISGPNIRSGSETSITVENYFDNWLNNEHKESISHSTYRRYSSLMRVHILPAIGRIKIIDLTRNDLSRVLTRMSKSNQSSRSQQQARAIMLLVCRHAFESGVIMQNPALGLRNIKLQSSPTSPLTLSEVKRLLSTFEGTPLNARLHIALICGLRQGEALGLRWSDIDFENQVIHVTQQLQKINRVYVSVGLKTSRSRRDVMLTDQTIKALQVLKNSTGDHNGLVFTSRDGQPLSTHVDYGNWKRALKLCGIPSKRLHDARHTAATLMYSQGIGIETISRALGHSNSAITSRLYVHSAEKPLRVAAQVMDSILR